MRNEKIYHKTKGFFGFYMEFQGYHFFDTILKKKIPKYLVWHNYRRYCEKITYTGFVVGRRFELKNRTGWKDGYRTKKI